MGRVLQVDFRKCMNEITAKSQGLNLTEGASLSHLPITGREGVWAQNEQVFNNSLSVKGTD